MSYKRLYVFTGKGGVGKTTCALSLANHLVLQGKKVLFVEFESQVSPEIFEQLKAKSTEIFEKIKETESYQQLSDRYQSLTPSGQKIVKFLGIGFIVFLFFLFCFLDLIGSCFLVGFSFQIG